MKTTAISSKLTLLTAAIILAAVSLSCGRPSPSTGIPPEIDEINDSLRAGNTTASVRLTELLKRAALARGDSMLWSEAMVQQGINAYYLGDPELMTASTDSALAWLERRPSSASRTRILSRAYQTYGAYYDQFSFLPDSAIHYLRKAVDYVELSGPRTSLPQVYASCANSFRFGGSLDSAALYYHRAITLADSLNLDRMHYIPLYNGIASVFTDMRDFDNGSKWWDKSLELLPVMNHYDRFSTMTGYGNHLYYKNDFKEAEKVFTDIKTMLDSLPGAEWEQAFNDVNLADVYIRNGAPRLAESMLDTTAAFFTTKIPNQMVISCIHTLKIMAATAKGEYQRGLQLAMKYPAADSLQAEQRLARLKALEEIYTNVGNHRLAYLTRCRYDRLNDSIRSYHLIQQISGLNAIYWRDNRILNLEAGNNRQQAHIYKLTAGIAISLAVIVGLVFIVVMRRIHMNRREQRMMDKIISLRQENLRNRVTPHFIYNALNHELRNTRKGKPSHLDALVDLIRKQQMVASEILIPFAQELKFTEDYITVFGDNGRDPLEYSCTVEEGLDTDFPFPSMTLETLVENAFKHGFSTLEPGSTRILRISVRKIAPDEISVSVFNNCGEAPSGIERGGTGLRVLLETIRLINEHNRRQTRFSINTHAEADGMYGCKATITLPDNLKP